VELDQLLLLLEQSRPHVPPAGAQASAKQDSSALSRADAATGAAGGQASGSSGRSRPLPEGAKAIRSLYFNSCNRAVKLNGFYKHPLDAIYLWPEPLAETLLKANIANTDADANSQKLSVLSPLLLSRTCAQYRARFPVPAALMCSVIEPPVIRAFNDARESMSSRYGMPSGSSQVSPVEVCLRLSTAQRGGTWVLARRLGERHLYSAVDGCSTLNELHEYIAATADVTFNRVVL